jgi:hypothetical protein
LDKKNLLIVSPAFPSAINGLGDYSYLLGKELSKNNHLTILYAGLAQKEAAKVAPYHVINHSNLQTIVAQLSISVVYLNYVNYAYHQKGIPFWLLKDIERVKKEGIKVFIFFHEINASSYKPWQSVFWLKPLQKYLYKKLYDLSNQCYCSNDRVFGILKESSRDEGKKLKKLGVFSNIPEPENLPSFELRKNVGVIFGSYGRRKEIYKNTLQLKQFIRDFKLTELIDIGAGDFPDIENDLEIIIRKKGVLERSEIASILLQSKWGLINYPDSLIGKSGIFSAYAAFGLSIYNINERNELALENLTQGKHYLSQASYNSNFDSKEASEHILKWYANRNLKEHISTLIKALTI